MKPSLSQIQALLSRVTSLPEKALSQEVDLLARGLLDSLQVVQLASEIELAFGLRLEPHDLTPENFASLARIHEFVGHKLAETRKAV